MKSKKEIVQKIVDDYVENFIVQLKLDAHIAYKRLYPYSINTIRIITYILNDNIYHAPLSLRIGCDGKNVDNVHAGGIVVGVTNEGYLKKFGYKLNYNSIYKKNIYHPNTKIIFENYKIPGTKEMIDIAKKCHTKTPHIGIIFWDFMANNNGDIILIEGNFMGQISNFP